MAFGYFVVTTSISSLVSFFTAIAIFRKWRNNKTVLSFGTFWFMMGWVWFFTVLANILWYFDKLSFSEITAQFSYMFVYLSGPFLIYYLVMNSVNKKSLAKIFFLIFAFGASVFAYVVFSEGLPSPHISQWAVKYGLSHDALYIMNIVYIFVVFFLFYGFFKRIINWIKGNFFDKNYLLLADLSIIIFLFYGYFELGILVSGWHLTLIRIIIIVSVLMSYLAYSSGPKEKKQKVFEV